MAATMATSSMNSSLVAGAVVGPRAGLFTGACSSPATAALPPRRRAPQVVKALKSDNDIKPDADPTTGEPVKLVEESESGNDKPSLWNAMKFNGPAPERINGRLAMLGFVSALAVEASRGVGLLSQAAGGVGMTWFAYSAVVLSAASLAPLLQGEKPEGWSRGVWRSDAELWNGRAAMIGLVALAATEYLTGSPLISSVSV